MLYCASFSHYGHQVCDRNKLRKEGRIHFGLWFRMYSLLWWRRQSGCRLKLETQLAHIWGSPPQHLQWSTSPALPHLKFPQLPTTSPAAGDHLVKNTNLWETFHVQAITPDLPRLAPSCWPTYIKASHSISIVFLFGRQILRSLYLGTSSLKEISFHFSTMLAFKCLIQD